MHFYDLFVFVFLFLEVPQDIVIPDQEESHGHSHAKPESHGHSHNGKPCHGHGTPAPAPKSESHGHSHNGKPCHGHGTPAPAPASNHGHSHGEAHGHSHNGKPCHGHGTPDQQQQQIPEDVMRKMKAVDVFMRVVVVPRLPIVFSKFAPLEGEKMIKENGIEVPDNAKRSMSASQFHEFVRSIQQGIADADFHGVVREEEVTEMEYSFYHMAQKIKTADPSQTLPESLSITRQEFMNMSAYMIARLVAARFDAAKHIIKNWGFDVKLPEIPLTNEEQVTTHIREFAYSEVAPVLTSYIEGKQAENVEEENPLRRWAVRDVLDSIVEGMEEANSENPNAAQVLKMVKELDADMVLEQCMGTSADGKGVNPRFLAFVVITNWATLMLGVDPDVATFVFKKWGLEVAIADEEAAIEDSKDEKVETETEAEAEQPKEDTA